MKPWPLQRTHRLHGLQPAAQQAVLSLQIIPSCNRSRIDNGASAPAATAAAAAAGPAAGAGAAGRGAGGAIHWQAIGIKLHAVAFLIRRVTGEGVRGVRGVAGGWAKVAHSKGRRGARQHARQPHN